MKRPLRARDPNGSCAFAVAPYCGGSYLTPAKWQMCGGSCSQKPRTRSRTVGVDSSRRRRDPPHGFSFHKRVARPSLSSAKNSPTARSRLRRSVLAGRKVRARHRHRSGLKIPPRPLSAPATPAKAGHAPCFIGPPALQKSAPEYRCLTATRCPARDLQRKEKARCRSRASLRVLRSFYGLSMVQGASKGRSPRRLMLQLHPKGGRFALADPPEHTGGPVSYRPEGRNPHPWFSFSNSVVSSNPFKRQERTRSAVAALEVPRSRAWKWRTADWHPSIRHRSGLKVPPRPLSATGMPSAKCCAILTEERGGRPGNASSPLSFPPFGNPPFLIPPPNSNPPKGGKPQGALARRPLWRG
jgi:hypothetical protein